MLSHALERSVHNPAQRIDAVLNVNDIARIVGNSINVSRRAQACRAQFSAAVDFNWHRPPVSMWVFSCVVDDWLRLRHRLMPG